MLELILASLAGFLGHKLERPTRKWFPVHSGDDGNYDDDMNRLVSYVEGGLIIQAVSSCIFMATLPRKYAILASALEALTWLGVGTGTVLGYIFDGVRPRQSE